MPILQETQKNFESLGLSPKLKPFNCKVLGLFINLFMALVSLWIFLIHEADSVQQYMESIFIVTAGTGIFLSFASTILITEKLCSFIKSFEESVNGRLENPASKAILENTNAFVEKWSKIGNLVMKYVVVLCLILPKTIFSFFIYFTSDLGNDAFDLPLPMWFPYDWKNPIGYLVAVFIECFFGLCGCQYIGSFMFLAFGLFMFAIVFVKILKNELRSINKMAKRKKYRKNMYKKLCEFIRTHANEKQLILSFSDLYEITLTIVFIVTLIVICSSMLMVQIEILLNETDLIILLKATVFGACASILLLFVCELGQRFTDAIDEIDDKIITLKWYLYPIEIQRFLPMVMSNTQKPVVIKCFGNVLCSREQFEKVFRTIRSDFLTLRKFYK